MTEREGNLQAPTRHPLDWRNPEFYDDAALDKELERIFDICHGCRRCVSLCQSFPTLFDLVDNSPTMEVDGVAKEDYAKVVDQCYLCDLCYMTKCPYVPPHPWNVDFPHLMLRAKAAKFKKEGARLRDRMLTSTDRMGRLATIPVVAQIVNKVNTTPAVRKVMDRTLGISSAATLPTYDSARFRETARRFVGVPGQGRCEDAGQGRGLRDVLRQLHRARNRPRSARDPRAQRGPVHARREGGVLRDAEAGARRSRLRRETEERQHPDACARCARTGHAILTGVPSCTLMFKTELPLMFPGDDDVGVVSEAMFDPFEYLVLRDKDGLLRKDFRTPLGKVSYHVPCHSRVQNIGQRTREALEWIPETTLNTVERCAGHDGTYGVKREFYANSMKIGTPVFKRMAEPGPDYITSDCPIAARRILHGIDQSGTGAATRKEHPLTLLRIAYGL